MRNQDQKGEILLAVELAEEKAKQHEKIEIAKKVIRLGIDKNTIQKSTDLLIETIEMIINEL